MKRYPGTGPPAAVDNGPVVFGKAFTRVLWICERTPGLRNGFSTPICACQMDSRAADCQRMFAASSEYMPCAYTCTLSFTSKVACRNAFLRLYAGNTSSMEFTP